MLFHLLSGTNLKKAAGIVMGVFGECNINDAPTLSLKEALDDLLTSTGNPGLLRTVPLAISNEW